MLHNAQYHHTTFPTTPQGKPLPLALGVGTGKPLPPALGWRGTCPRCSHRTQDLGRGERHCPRCGWLGWVR